MIDQKKWKFIAITFCAITLVLIVLVIVLPIVIKDNIQTSYVEKSKPNLENTNLWAKFPGDIKTTMTHKFSFLDYSEKKPKIKDSFTLEEEISYDKFNYTENDDKLSFDAKSKFKLSRPAENKTIKTLNLGMFETLEAFSNPTKYQKGINSLQYLISKAFPKPDLFIRQIFTYYLYNDLIVDEERVRETVLKNVDKEKADKILSVEGDYAEYSFKKITGFFKWIKILGLPEEIEKATWLTSLYNLTPDEIDSVLGKNNFLDTSYIDYNGQLAEQFDCEDKKACGIELLYTQLMSGNVTKSVGLDGMSNLYQLVEPEFYPFSKSPELTIFFEEYKKLVGKPDIKYEDYAPNVDQLNALINSSSPICLLSANNSALLLVLNQTGNTNKVNEIYNISKNILYFMSDYIYEYLPSLFLYQEFTDESGEKYTVDPLAKAQATFAQAIVDKTYKLLINTKGMYNFILSEVVWKLLLEKINYNNIGSDAKQNEPDEVCPLIMQKALDDGRKVLKICSDPKTAFDSAETLIKWFAPYYCVVYEEQTGCDMSLIDYLKTIVYITDEEIKAIYNKDYLGGFIEDNDKYLKEVYKCDENCDDEYLSKKQFWKSELSKNVPEPFTKSSTFSTLFPDKFPFPVEMTYFREILGETEEISEQDIDYLISLTSKGDTILSEEDSQILVERTNLEKEFTLIMKGKKEKKETKYKTIDILINGYLFSKETTSNYSNVYNIIQGNAIEDKKYVDFLSGGDFFDNYKPNLTQTTGFNFGFDLPNGKEKNISYDKYGIYGKKDDTDHTMRKIISINDLPILNIKKSEYNYLLKDYSTIDAPILNYQTLTGDKSFIDGFQYEAEEEPIYFYDRISSRPYKFNYVEDSEFKDIDCLKYEIDKDDLANNMNEVNDKNTQKALLTQKLNKPFMISVGNSGLSSEIDNDVSEENYICVDPFTNMVVDSKINFVYSVYTKKYGYINPYIENEKVYPVFTYQKSYEVDIDSYNDYFPNIKSYYTFKLVFLIIGIICIIVCAIISLLAFLKLHKSLVKEDIVKNGPSNEKLINDSSASLTNRTTENKE